MTGVGLKEVRLGRGAVIVRASARMPVPALGLVTETVRGPGVVLARMVMVAVSWVLDTKALLLTVMPAPKLDVAPLAKPVPVIVNVAPPYGALLVGEIDERAGQGLAAVIVKNRALEVPPPGAGVKTVTLAVWGVMEIVPGLLARSAARMLAVS